MNNKRQSLSLARKMESLRSVTQGKKKSLLAIEFRVKPSILKDRKKIENAFNDGRISSYIKKMRHPYKPELDNVLLKWFQSARSQNLPLSDLLLIDEPRDLAKSLGYSDDNIKTIDSSWI